MKIVRYETKRNNSRHHQQQQQHSNVHFETTQGQFRPKNEKSRNPGYYINVTYLPTTDVEEDVIQSVGSPRFLRSRPIYIYIYIFNSDFVICNHLLNKDP